MPVEAPPTRIPWRWMEARWDLFTFSLFVRIQIAADEMAKCGLIMDLLDIGNWRDSKDMIVDVFRTVACRIELSARVGIINEKRNRNQKFEETENLGSKARTNTVGATIIFRLAGATAPLQFSFFCVSGRWDFNCCRKPTRILLER